MIRSLTPFLRSQRAARRRLAQLAQAAALGGVSLALLAPAAHAQNARSGADRDDPRAERQARRAARQAARLGRPVRDINARMQAGADAPSAAQPSVALPPDAVNPFGLTAPAIPTSNAASTLADLDGDGDLDRLAIEREGSEFAYFRNDAAPGGAAQFQAQQSGPFGLDDLLGEDSRVEEVTAADLDADGDLDVLVYGFLGYSRDLYIFENTGTATAPSFGDVSPERAGIGNILVRELQLADLDGDGDLDLFFLNGETVLQSENTGSATQPTFSDSFVQNPNGLGPATLDGRRVSSGFALFDVDGDLDLDAVFTGYAGFSGSGAAFAENVGTATAPDFAPLAEPSFLPAALPGGDTGVGDLDGDGDLDLVLTNTSIPSFVENEGTATAPDFADPVVAALGLTAVEVAVDLVAPTLADLDGDGDLDVFGAVPGRRGLTFAAFENEAAPGQTPQFAEPRPLALRVNGYGPLPTLADFDGDGDFDLVRANYSYDYGGFGRRSGGDEYVSDLVFYPNEAAPGALPEFGEAQTVTRLDDTGEASDYALAVADLDGDGDLDLLARTPPRFERTPEGFVVTKEAFAYFENTAGPGAPPTFADARPDPFGLPPGAESNTSRFDATSLALALADFDGDGDLDLLVPSTADESSEGEGPRGPRGRLMVEAQDGFAYFENTAGPGVEPAFAAPVYNPDGLEPVGAESYPTAGDLDGDGRIDVLVGREGGDLVFFSDVTPESAARSAQVAGDAGWRTLAAPASGSTVGELFSTVFTQGFSGSSVGAEGEPSVFLYDETEAGNLGQGYRPPASASELVGLGRGVFGYLFEDDDVTQPEVQGGFPKTLSVTGTPATETFGWGAAGPGPLSFTDTGAPDDDGWNLLGNPFASWFDWDAVELQGVNAPVYVYDDATSGYLTYSEGAGDLPGGVIDPFVGFWVQANADAPGLTAPEGTAPAARREAPLAVMLTVRPEEDRPERSSATVVWGTPGAEPDRDALDAVALVGLAPDRLRLGTVVDGAGLAIDHRPALDGADEVALAVQAEGALAGQRLVISWPSFDAAALPAGTSVVLRDAETGAELDLAGATEYAFTASTETGRRAGDTLAIPAPEVLRVGGDAARTAGRFTMAVTQAATDAEDGAAEVALSDAFPNPATHRATLRLTLPSTERVRATVYDALGRAVVVAFDGPMSGAGEVRIDASSLAPGAYLVRIEGESFAQARRFTIIR